MLVHHRAGRSDPGLPKEDSEWEFWFLQPCSFYAPSGSPRAWPALVRATSVASVVETLNEAVDIVIGVAGTLCAVVLGFLTVITWQDFR